MNDHGWVEFVHERPSAPDIFYNLRVAAIRAVQIPKKFVSCHSGTTSWPATSRDLEGVVELQSMVGQPFDQEFYIIDFESIDEQVPRTFIGAPVRLSSRYVRGAEAPATKWAVSATDLG